MTAHIHAAQILQYAHDAAETDKPWERWEYRGRLNGDEWSETPSTPTWLPAFEYRRKPETIRIGTREVPKPLRVAPDYGTVCWAVELTAEVGACDFVWGGNRMNTLLLQRGLVHLTEAAAGENRAAILSLLKESK